MSTHAVTVFFARCETCGLQGPNRASQLLALKWLNNHHRRVHKRRLPSDPRNRMAGVGPYPENKH